MTSYTANALEATQNDMLEQRAARQCSVPESNFRDMAMGNVTIDGNWDPFIRGRRDS